MRREKPCLLCGQEPEEKKHCTYTVIIGEEELDLCPSCYTHLMLVCQDREKPNDRELRLLFPIMATVALEMKKTEMEEKNLS